jgi:hypothetical protein
MGLVSLLLMDMPRGRERSNATGSARSRQCAVYAPAGKIRHEPAIRFGYPRALY